MKSLNLTALFPSAACAGIFGNDGTEMYGEVTTGVETERVTFGY